MNTKKYHYVYRIINNNPTDSRKYYIGVRTSNVSPEKDVKYMGSSKSLASAIREFGFQQFVKEILSVWDTREEANLEEIRLHQELKVSKNPEYYNLSEATSTGFCTFGRVAVFDSLENKTKSVSKEDFEKNDNYDAVSAGFLMVIDVRDGLVKRIITDEYHNNKDYYQHVNAGYVTVIDTRNSTTVRVSIEDYEHYDYYQSINKYKTVVLDIRDGVKKLVSTEDYKNFDYYRSINKDKVSVIDIRDGKSYSVSKDDYIKFDYYVSPNENMVVVKDSRDGRTYRVTKEEYDNSEHYRPINEGTVNVLDTRDGVKKQVSKDDFEKFDYYEALTKGTVMVRDLRTGKNKRVQREDLDRFEYYVSIKAKKIEVYDDNDTLFGISFGDFSKFCKKYRLSCGALTKSYKNNGLPIFLNIDNCTRSKLINQNRDFQIGWYAKLVK